MHLMLMNITVGVFNTTRKRLYAWWYVHIIGQSSMPEIGVYNRGKGRRLYYRYAGPGTKSLCQLELGLEVYTH